MGLFGSLFKGGDSQSAQTTNNTDARVVGGDASTNASIVGNTGTVNLTDHNAIATAGAVAGLAINSNGKAVTDALGFAGGAVEDSLQFAGDTMGESLKLALRGVELSSATTRETVAANGGLLTGALRMASEQNEQTLGTLQDLKSADVRTLSMVGIAVVGLVAIVMLPKLMKG